MIVTFIIPVILATVVNGSAETSTRVRTSVSGGNATVETNVTTEVNGQRMTIQNNAPGTLEVQHRDNSYDVRINGQPITPTITFRAPSPTASSTSVTAREVPVTTIGDTKLSHPRYYVYDAAKCIAASVRAFFKNLLDKL